MKEKPTMYKKFLQSALILLILAGQTWINSAIAGGTREKLAMAFYDNLEGSNSRRDCLGLYRQWVPLDTLPQKLQSLFGKCAMCNENPTGEICPARFNDTNVKATDALEAAGVQSMWAKLVGIRPELPPKFRAQKLQTRKDLVKTKAELISALRALDVADQKAKRAKLIAEAVATTVEAEKPAHAATQTLVKTTAAQLAASQVAAEEMNKKSHAATQSLVKRAALDAHDDSASILEYVQTANEMLCIVGSASAAGAAVAVSTPRDDEAHFRKMAAESLAKKAASEARKAELEEEEAQLRVELLKAQIATLKLGQNGGTATATAAASELPAAAKK